MSSSKLMIVAHPDDETIFGGSQLILEKGWKVICVTNRENNVRYKEFCSVMKQLGAEYEIWDYKDKWGGGFDVNRLKKDLCQVLAERKYDKILTHNAKGEYGHTQHIALYKIVFELVNENLYVFDLSNKKLDKDILEKKIKLLKLYKSQNIDWLKKYIKYEGLKKIK